MLKLIRTSAFTSVQRLFQASHRCFHEELTNSDPKDEQKVKMNLRSRKIFDDADSVTILDVEEERLISSLDQTVKLTSIYDNLNLTRKFSSKHSN
jgi:hypothetical protein